MASAKYPKLAFFLRHAGRRVFGRDVLETTPDADGHFRLENVYSGDYLILPSDPPPFYLDSVTMGGAPVTADVALSAGSPVVRVIYKSNGGSVRGTVEKCGSGRVFLVAEAPPLPALPLVAGTTRGCDANGHFEIDNVRPGDYCAFALPGGRVPKADGDSQLLRTARRLSVRAGEVAAVELTLSETR